MWSKIKLTLNHIKDKRLSQQACLDGHLKPEVMNMRICSMYMENSTGEQHEALYLKAGPQIFLQIEGIWKINALWETSSPLVGLIHYDIQSSVLKLRLQFGNDRGSASTPTRYRLSHFDFNDFVVIKNTLNIYIFYTQT